MCSSLFPSKTFMILNLKLTSIVETSCVVLATMSDVLSATALGGTFLPPHSRSQTPPLGGSHCDVLSRQVVQIYLTWDPSNAAAPLRQLVAFRRVFIPTGHAQRLTFTVRGHQMEVWVDDVIGFNVLPGAGVSQPWH